MKVSKQAKRAYKKITSNLTATNLSMKAWANTEIKAKSPLAPMLQKWLENKLC